MRPEWEAPFVSKSRLPGSVQPEPNPDRPAPWGEAHERTAGDVSLPDLEAARLAATALAPVVLPRTSHLPWPNVPPPAAVQPHHVRRGRFALVLVPTIHSNGAGSRPCRGTNAGPIRMPKRLPPGTARSAWQSVGLHCAASLEMTLQQEHCDGATRFQGFRCPGRKLSDPTRKLLRDPFRWHPSSSCERRSRISLSDPSWKFAWNRLAES